MNLRMQIRCVELEIKRREKIFPKLVSEGKMTKDYADKEIFMMKDVRMSLIKAKVNRKDFNGKKEVNYNRNNRLINQ